MNSFYHAEQLINVFSASGFNKPKTENTLLELNYEKNKNYYIKKFRDIELVDGFFINGILQLNYFTFENDMFLANTVNVSEIGSWKLANKDGQKYWVYEQNGNILKISKEDPVNFIKNEIEKGDKEKLLKDWFFDKSGYTYMVKKYTTNEFYINNVLQKVYYNKNYNKIVKTDSWHIIYFHDKSFEIKI